MSKPRKGDEVKYRGEPAGIVSSVEGNLCWVEYYGQSGALPFIWRFKEGLNDLHDWPSKDDGKE